MEKVTLAQLLTKNIEEKIICFPTDTVYGVGARLNDGKAINKIYQMKNRDQNKPLAILVPNKDISNLVLSLSPLAEQLIENYWPGAYTFLFLKNDCVSGIITKDKPTVALRMPDSAIALSILSFFGPLATTSVNISGEKELNSVDQIEEQFAQFIDYLVIDEQSLSNKPSTIIDATGEVPIIIRK